MLFTLLYNRLRVMPIHHFYVLLFVLIGLVQPNAPFLRRTDIKRPVIKYNILTTGAELDKRKVISKLWTKWVCKL